MMAARSDARVKRGKRRLAGTSRPGRTGEHPGTETHLSGLRVNQDLTNGLLEKQGSSCKRLPYFRCLLLFTSSVIPLTIDVEFSLVLGA